tara:strand:- start:185 stop:442 length:258 start_codon:yes stop_codon:yes gene_type:complete
VLFINHPDVLEFDIDLTPFASSRVILNENQRGKVQDNLKLSSENLSPIDNRKSILTIRYKLITEVLQNLTYKHEAQASESIPRSI